MNNPKTYCFDLDGTLCITIDGDYKNSKPIEKHVKFDRNSFEHQFLTLGALEAEGRPEKYVKNKG